jgi:hypothetical protein
MKKNRDAVPIENTSGISKLSVPHQTNNAIIKNNLDHVENFKANSK